MLTRKLLNGETLSSETSVLKSKSSQNIYEEFNKKNKQMKIPITESIYDRFTFLKASKITQSTKQLRRLSQDIKAKKRKEIESFYSAFLKSSAKSVFDKLYITSSKPNEGYSIDSSMHSKTSDNHQATKDDLFSTELKGNHMKMEISALFNIPKTAFQLSHCCRNILFLKNISILEQSTVSEKEKRHLALVNNLNKKAIELREREQMLKAKYYQQIENYFAFLFRKRDQERQLLNDIRNERITATFELDKVINLVAKAKMDLDRAIRERNFLVKVKEKIVEFPLVFLALIEKESKNQDILSSILKFESKMKPEAIIAVLQEEKYQKQYSDEVITYNKTKQNLSKEKRDEHDKREERFKSYANKTYLPFEYPEDLITEINNLERLNIVSLSFTEKIKHQTDQLKLELSEIKGDSIKYDSYIQSQIDIKEKQKHELIRKHNSLAKLKESMIKQSLLKAKHMSNNNTSNANQMNSLSSSASELMKYQSIYRRFPIEFSCIYSKLSFIVTHLIEDTDFGDTIASLYTKEELNGLLNMKLSKKNQGLIHATLIKLFKLYEKGANIILFKQRGYLSDPSAKEKTLKAAVERQKETKIKNALEQRINLQSKREMERKKIIFKNSKIIYLPKKKVMEKFYIASHKKARRSSRKIDSKELTLGELINYDETE